MDRTKRTRPSPALVISVIALSVALGGSALATSAITSKDVNKKGNLKKNAVKKKNIAKNAVVTGKIKNEKVTGSKLSEGAVSAEKLGSITEVTSTPTPLTVGVTGTATATCPEGSKVVGGGFGVAPFAAATSFGIPQESKRSNNGWSAKAIGQFGAETITAYAYCLTSSDG